MSSLTDNVFVIVRSSKERSLPLCLNALKRQTDQYIVIEEYPFLNAVKRTLDLGKDLKQNFLLALDADVVLYDNALQRIVQEAQAKESNFLCMDCRVLDKFSGHVLAGCHLFNSKFLKDLSTHFSKVGINDQEMRPERANLEVFAEKNGLILGVNSFEAGLHDYEQYYYHLYMKYYRRAIRWPKLIDKTLAVIQSRRQKFSSEDQDFDVVLAGFKAGIGQQSASFDARTYPTIKTLMGIVEKSELLS